MRNHHVHQADFRGLPGFDDAPDEARRSAAHAVDAAGIRPLSADLAAIAAPIHDGETVAGVVALLADDRDAFTESDAGLLASIGRQIGIAVGNARLYERVHRAKMEWERTFDAISDPIAVFDAGRRTMRTNAAMAALRGWPIVHSQGRSCDDTGLCGGGAGCLVQQALDGVSASAEITTPEGRIFAITTLPVPADRAAVLVAKEVTEERAQARRLRALSDELSATNVALTRTVEQLQDTQAQLVQAEQVDDVFDAATHDVGGQPDVLHRVGQLVLDVPEVDVHRNGTDLEGGEHALEVLGAVVEVERHAVAGPDAVVDSYSALEAATAIGRGADVAEVFHVAGPGQPQIKGRDPQGRSYFSYATFKDPDGNGWLLQEVTARLPGRVDPSQTTFASVADLAAAWFSKTIKS